MFSYVTSGVPSAKFQTKQTHENFHKPRIQTEIKQNYVKVFGKAARFEGSIDGVAPADREEEAGGPEQPMVEAGGMEEVVAFGKHPNGITVNIVLIAYRATLIVRAAQHRVAIGGQHLS